MEINIENEQFAEWISEISNCILSDDNEDFIFTFNRNEEYILKLNKDKLSSEINKLREYTEVSETVISNGNTYEILVREEGQYFRFSPRENDHIVAIEDTDNQLNYKLTRPSYEFTLFLIYKTAMLGHVSELRRPIPLSRMYGQWTNDNLDMLDVIKRIIGGKLTLQIFSEHTKSNSEFEKYSSAFLFNLTYNTDSALVPQRDFDELLRSSRIIRNRRFDIEELDPPRRYYVPDLVHHYQLAVGTENPMLEYISYYHIAEHFFESIFNDELIDKVKTKITHPDFSYKRKKDISSLIKDIGKSIKMRDESMTFNEQEGLRLTLIKLVNIDDLIEKLNGYDETLLDFYINNTVAFAGAPVLNLNMEDRELVYKHMANRIYKVRNSIVHSKETEKTKYTPFRDDKTLVKEVPLIRFIAEQIIFSTSQIV
jgi:hypothetical protein